MPVKEEPQSLHWSHEQVTVHLGILKYGERKAYHAYFFDYQNHNHHFVHLALQEMLQETAFDGPGVMVIESDNCSSQYKSAAHFLGVQEICDQMQVKVIRVFRIPEHGKGEVDHMGGITKIKIRVSRVSIFECERHSKEVQGMTNSKARQLNFFKRNSRRAA